MNEELFTYNLLEEKWIPVLYHDGRTERVGIYKAFEDAHLIRQIAASNPMDRVAILRFLLAILYWCKGNPPDDKIANSSNSFPKDWFSKLDENKDCFNLLGDGKRFYQDNSTSSSKNKKLSANYLVQEVPTGTNFYHFRHSTDKTSGLCPACCVAGLLRLPLFATSGGQGKPPGINAKPPVYVIPIGSSLANTILLSWHQVSNIGMPAWEKPDLELPENGVVPLLMGLTWLPRRVWLDAPAESKADNCISCGRKEYLIQQCVFDGIGSTQPITEVPLDKLLAEIIIPKNLEKRISLDKSKKVLRLKGDLKEKDKDKLLKLSAEPEYQEAIKGLYSSQSHREWSDPHVIYDNDEVIRATNTLKCSDAAAGQWTKIMAGILSEQKTNGKTWIVGFATVQNDKYLEAMEYELPLLASADQNIQESIKKIEQWQEKSRNLEDRLRKIVREKRKPRKDDARIAVSSIASIRPHVEHKVSEKATVLLTGGDIEWEQAANEYKPMMKAIAKSCSPGFTTAAVERQRQIERVMPNMKQNKDASTKTHVKKGGDK